MRLGRFALSAACCGWLLFGVGCGDDDSAPAAPSGGGKGNQNPSGGGVGRRDAGHPPDEEDEDAGAIVRDSGMLGGDIPRADCKDVEAAAYMSDTTLGDYNNAIGQPKDFKVTRVVATWAYDCRPATILIALSDGRCTSPGEHELRFYVEADAIVNGTVIAGQNTIVPEDDSHAIRVRYHRPDELSPSGNWGSCTGAQGMLNIKGTTGELDANRLGNLQAMFDLELTACDGSSEGVQTVLGTFNVTMRRDLNDVCPKI